MAEPVLLTVLLPVRNETVNLPRHAAHPPRRSDDAA